MKNLLLPHTLKNIYNITLAALVAVKFSLRFCNHIIIYVLLWTLLALWYLSYFTLIYASWREQGNFVQALKTNKLETIFVALPPVLLIVIYILDTYNI